MRGRRLSPRGSGEPLRLFPRFGFACRFFCPFSCRWPCFRLCGEPRLRGVAFLFLPCAPFSLLTPSFSSAAFLLLSAAAISACMSWSIFLSSEAAFFFWPAMVRCNSFCFRLSFSTMPWRSFCCPSSLACSALPSARRRSFCCFVASTSARFAFTLSSLRCMSRPCALWYFVNSCT